MTTLIDSIMPPREYLQEVLQSVLVDGLDEKTYIANVLKNISDLISKNPGQYSLYGPWWPAIKKLIIDSGDESLGLSYPDDVAEIYCYDLPSLTLVAGILYCQERVSDHTVTDSYHFLPVNPSADDSDPYLYISYDESLDKYKLDQVL